MIALAIILGIIVFFALVLSIRVHISLDYCEAPACTVRWLFVKLQLYPPKEKKKKKDKPEKAKKEKKEEKTEKPAEEKPKEKKENPIMVFFKREGAEGVYELLKRTVSAINGTLGAIIRQFKIEELYLEMVVAAGDAAATAQKYGETCAKFFPLLGAIVTHFNVKKYDIDISPDFLANKGETAFYTTVSASPRKIINSALALVIKLLFGVLLKFLWGARQKKPKQPKPDSPKPVDNTAKITENKAQAS